MPVIFFHINGDLRPFAAFDCLNGVRHQVHHNLFDPDQISMALYRLFRAVPLNGDIGSALLRRHYL